MIQTLGADSAESIQSGNETGYTNKGLLVVLEFSSSVKCEDVLHFPNNKTPTY